LINARSDISLNIGKADHEVRLQFQNAIDLGAGECRHRGFSRRARADAP
jgi:hypothetical protein